MKDKDKKKSLNQYTWRLPLLINIVALIGIIVALIGHGWLDALSWLCLGGCSVFVIYKYYFTSSVR